MFSSIMMDPFVLGYPATLTATNQALQATIAACWPRLANTPWQEELLKVLVVCWLNVHDNTKFPHIDKDLVQTANMLSAVMTVAKVDMAATIGPLVAREPQLGILFSESASG